MNLSLPNIHSDCHSKQIIFWWNLWTEAYISQWLVSEFHKYVLDTYYIINDDKMTFQPFTKKKLKTPPHLCTQQVKIIKQPEIHKIRTNAKKIRLELSISNRLVKLSSQWKIIRAKAEDYKFTRAKGNRMPMKHFYLFLMKPYSVEKKSENNLPLQTERVVGFPGFSFWFYWTKKKIPRK